MSVTILELRKLLDNRFDNEVVLIELIDDKESRIYSTSTIDKVEKHLEHFDIEGKAHTGILFTIKIDGLILYFDKN